MCLSCGCGQAMDDHGDKRNITMATIEKAAEAAGLSVDDVCENIDAGVAGGSAQAPADEELAEGTAS